MSFALPSAAAGLPIAARFKLLARCHNCWRTSSDVVSVPETDDAPQSADELMESAFLGQIRFKCEQCESAICTIIGATPVLESGSHARARS